MDELELSDEEWFNYQLGFNRGVLRNSPQFIEKDFEGANPRELMRKIRRRIQDITRDGRFKFEIIKDPIEVKKEKVGQYSGFVRGGLLALHKKPSHEGGTISYNPYRKPGEIMLSFGVIALFFGLLFPRLEAFSELEMSSAFSLSIIGGVALCALGTFAFFYKEIENFPIDITSRLRALVLGEIWEKALEKKGSRETKIRGNISTVFSGDTIIELRSLENYRSTLKEKVKNVDALVMEISKLKTEIMRENCLENRENMKEPPDPQKIKLMQWPALIEELENEFGTEQVISWMSEKLVKKGVTEEASISGLEEDLGIVKKEVQKLAKGIADYVERGIKK